MPRTPPHAGPDPLESADRVEFDTRLAAARQWHLETGWPGKEQDMALAQRLLIQFLGPTEPDEVYAAWHSALSRALLEQLSETSSPDELPHRHLLCLLLIRAATLEFGL